jgi:glycosyltransferase involved in cell wall biosynthesis
LNISVIIPVYNAAPFLRKAVESALAQEETAEILLIEDCSTDNSLEICQQLEQEYEKVKLFRHADGKNHGAGASRNLGIENASCEFVAFLDADDYYLTNRFKQDQEILTNDLTIEGVYNALGIEYYQDTDEIRKRFNSRELTTVTEKIDPEKLFDEMAPFGSKGYFSCDTLTIKKAAFRKAGLFNTALKVTQDTHMWVRLAAVCKLAAGSIDKPVAIRGVHENNRSTPEEIKRYHFQLYKTLFTWAAEKQIAHSRVIKIWEYYYEQNAKKIFNYPFVKRRLTQLAFLLYSVIKYPKILPFLIAHSYQKVSKRCDSPMFKKQRLSQ